MSNGCLVFLKCHEISLMMGIRDGQVTVFCTCHEKRWNKYDIFHHFPQVGDMINGGETSKSHETNACLLNRCSCEADVRALSLNTRQKHWPDQCKILWTAEHVLSFHELIFQKFKLLVKESWSDGDERLVPICGADRRAVDFVLGWDIVLSLQS